MADLDKVLTLIHRGKVRNTYATAFGNLLLLVASDRISTHNVVHLSEVKGKGETLNILTIYWLTQVLTDTPNHLVAYGTDIYEYLPSGTRELCPDLHLRSVVVKKLDMIPVEFIYRRYLPRSSSLWKAYSTGKDPYGLNLAEGLEEMHRFDQVLFTPTDKSETDDPLNTAATIDKYSDAHALALQAFLRVEQRLVEIGITLIDTKLELGVESGNPTIVLADEVFTPDSSRFTLTKDIELGVEPPWLDKQPVRDEATRIWDGGPKKPLSFDRPLLGQVSRTYRDLIPGLTGRPYGEWYEQLSAN